MQIQEDVRARLERMEKLDEDKQAKYLAAWRHVTLVTAIAGMQGPGC